MRTTTRAAFAAASTFALVAGLLACSPPNEEPSDVATSATSAVGSAADQAGDAAGAATSDEAADAVVELVDGWVRARDEDMTAVFGTLRNTGSEDVQLTAVSGDVGESQELHETVPGGSGMMMREKQDGFVIPAGGELVLEPGGNHIMIMGLTEPITTGQEVTLTLEFADGRTQDVTVSARSFEGGDEEYVPEGGEHGGDQGAAGHGGADHEGPVGGEGMDHDG